MASPLFADQGGKEPGVDLSRRCAPCRRVVHENEAHEAYQGEGEHGEEYTIEHDWPFWLS